MWNVVPRIRTAAFPRTERRAAALVAETRSGTPCPACSQPRPLAPCVLDIGGVVLRNGRELVRGSADDEPGVADYVERLDFAGPGDELWQRMLRHEVTERAYWAQRAGEIGQLLGHDDWSTYDLITWLYHRPRGRTGSTTRWSS